ncbi:Protein DCL, chloroplastic [Heracleum sosnowskyi]|uniref:Protein DCL, chloroplastic n=1 Tax=Heracleum sosnowskyi TaxID=360622 RepID=A0AAD8NDD9_9APIA|nr:Protein DCL, chloroplastic [Heracleum sosnowskyi]
MAAPLLLRTIPLFRHRLQPLRLAVAVSLLTRRPCSTLTRPDEYFSPALHNDSLSRVKDESLSHSTRIDDPDYRKWKDKEQEILNDVKPITLFAKDLIHSSRYMDGERLTEEDEKTVLEKLLAYHPHSEDKLGCGLNFIMVDRHPQFRQSRCLFIVRTDGGWIDFSYQKCLRSYIRHKYPSYAEKFIKEHYKRSS